MTFWKWMEYRFIEALIGIGVLLFAWVMLTTFATIAAMRDEKDAADKRTDQTSRKQ